MSWGVFKNAAIKMPPLVKQADHYYHGWKSVTFEALCLWALTASTGQLTKVLFQCALLEEALKFQEQAFRGLNSSRRGWWVT